MLVFNSMHKIVLNRIHSYDFSDKIWESHREFTGDFIFEEDAA